MVFDIAVDVGTTNIGVSLLEDGRKVFEKSVMGSLRRFGADIITRLAKYREQPNACSLYQQLILDDIAYILHASQYKVEAIRNAAFAANTVMSFFLVGKDASSLGTYPFSGTIDAHDTEKFRQRFSASGVSVSSVLFPPLIGGFVGSDMFSVLSWLGKHAVGGIYLVVDLGTNAEVAVHTPGAILVASTAAGPAFGYRGSELIHNAASGIMSGAIDSQGNLKQETTVTQQQVRDLQVAKAALYTGVEVLIQESGVRPEDITKIYLAGVFGGLVSREDIRAVKLLPELNAGVECIGNAALAGLEDMLQSPENPRGESVVLERRIRHIELANTSQFSVNYMRNLHF